MPHNRSKWGKQGVDMDRKWEIIKDSKNRTYIKPNSIGDTKNKRGAISELYACSYLSELGYEVFRNVASSGPIDLVAIREGEVLCIDVKTFMPSIKSDYTIGNASSPQIKEDQKIYNVKHLYVTYDGDCSFNMSELMDILTQKIFKIKGKPRIRKNKKKKPKMANER